MLFNIKIIIKKAFLNTLNLTLEFADKNLAKYLVIAEPSRK